MTTLDRRQFLTLGGGLVGLATLGACGSSGASGQPAAGSTQSSATGAGPFPVTVTHEFGTTTVDAAPSRVVSLGYTDHDILLALGVVPVGIAQGNSSWKSGVGPWAEKALGEARPEQFAAPFDYEKVAALTPDLITDVWSGQDRAEFEKLNKIGPTVGAVKGFQPYGSPWQDRTRLIASAIGRAGDGDKLVADNEALIADQAKAHPEFVGKTSLCVWSWNGKLGAYRDSDPRTRLLAGLGFVPNDYTKTMTEEQNLKGVSSEQVDLLDADVIVVQGVQGQTEASFYKDYPVFKTLDAAKQGRVYVMEDYDAVLAYYSSSPLSIGYTLDAMIPGLAKAAAAS